MNGTTISDQCLRSTTQQSNMLQWNQRICERYPKQMAEWSNFNHWRFYHESSNLDSTWWPCRCPSIESYQSKWRLLSILSLLSELATHQISAIQSFGWSEASTKFSVSPAIWSHSNLSIWNMSTICAANETNKLVFQRNRMLVPAPRRSVLMQPTV